MHDRRRTRWHTATATAMAVALPGSVLALTQAPASAAPLPAPYSADAHADIVTLDTNLLGQELLGLDVGHSRSTLAGLEVLELTALPLLGTLAEVTASETRTRTYLDDNGAGGSDVVSRATTTVGDISLLGGAVTIQVTDPVVLEARSDGTTGSAGYQNPHGFPPLGV